MVERSINLDTIFQSLADETRRDILRRVSQCELSISELANVYAMSFAAVAKHVGVLEGAGLVAKRREGKQQLVTVVPKTLQGAEAYLSTYQALWEARFTALDGVLKK